MKKFDARSLSPEAQEDLRMRVVSAVHDGRTQVDVAATFGIPRQTVGRWVHKVRKGGEKSLKARRRGRPKGGSLKPSQAAQITKAIIDRTPDQLKLPFFLWTREAVVELIERRFGIRLSVWTVGRYLARWGFTPQKPKRMAFERDPERVKQWLEAEYPAIRARAKREGAEIYWGDEMGLRSDHATGTSYGKRGQTPVIPGTGQRFRCNMISAITNRGRLNFMVFKERFTTTVFRTFLKRMIRQVPKKVFLIVDGHPVHRAAGIKRWVATNADRIELFSLPSYSPDLNPDEMLNQDVKSNAVGRRRPRNQTEMITQLRGYLRSRQRTPQVVARYFHEKSVLYAAI